ncbi:DUF1963 domain-containing protein [Streptomyces cyaneofuscatus]|uniref:DUF1963 domain-containing protein n=1 Tax=Streptomyces cyaneofuscatus TaxID=66883 RepID=UPI00363FF0C3
MTHGSRDAFRSLALRHLPPDDAEKWLGLLRPGARLRVATGADVPAVRLGGLPALPAGSPWPVWDGHGPLSFIASVDCARLPTAALDIGLPESGTLLLRRRSERRLRDSGRTRWCQDAADMMWGDAGVLYWLIRPEDLAERRFERAMLTWQCF